jgi:hypothetical protein
MTNNVRFLIASALVIYFGASAAARGQACPKGRVDNAALIANVTQAARQFEQDHPNQPVDAAIIYRSAAIGGQALIPALRQIAKPGMPPGTIPGAAQVSLAKLGDRVSLDQIEQELQSGNGAGFPAQKLGRVGNAEAVEVLLKYFFAHAYDPSRYHNYGDYGTDSMMSILDALSSFARNPPTVGPGGSISGDTKEWTIWWDRNKSNPLAFSLSGGLHNPYTQCLARKVEWGFPEAILDLGIAGDPQAMPALRTLTDLGDQRNRASGIETIRGRAQAALARFGDTAEFQAIVSELESPGSNDAVLKLRYIGGRKAAEAMLESLKGTNFLAEFPDWKYDGINAPGVIYDHDAAIANILAKMVVAPPDTSGDPKNKKRWLAWWAKNKDTAQFLPSPDTTSE